MKDNLTNKEFSEGDVVQEFLVCSCGENEEHTYLLSIDGRNVHYTCTVCGRVYSLGEAQVAGFDKWLREVDKRKYNTVKNYLSQYRKIPEDITLFQETDTLAGRLNLVLRESDKSLDSLKKTINKYLEYCFEVFPYKQFPELLEEHRRRKIDVKNYLEIPYSKRQNRKVLSVVEKYIPPEATYRILEAMEVKPKTITACLYDMGLRPVELFGNVVDNLTVLDERKRHRPVFEDPRDCLRFPDWFFHVPSGLAKTTTSKRSIRILMPETRALLANWIRGNRLEGGDFLFSVWDGGSEKEFRDLFLRRQRDGYNRVLRRYSKSTGFLPAREPIEYWWRHTRITQLIDVADTVSLDLIEQAGHSDSKMIMRVYREAGRHLDRRTLEQWMKDENKKLTI